MVFKKRYRWFQVSESIFHYIYHHLLHPHGPLDCAPAGPPLMLTLARPPLPILGASGAAFGSFLAIDVNTSMTLAAVLADVSMKRRLHSSAYALASSKLTARLLAKSSLFPARAMTIVGLA